jgi:hypothetical protein
VSHLVTIYAELRDAEALLAACQRLGLSPPAQGKFKLYSAEAEGLAVQLPGWQYPVVAELASGKLHYDNFQGRWGDQSELNRLIQAYAVEKARIEARRRGHTVAEQTLPDGSIKLTIQVAGGDA